MSEPEPDTDDALGPVLLAAIVVLLILMAWVGGF